MIAFDIILDGDGDGAWPDLREKGYAKGTIDGATALPNGTVSGKPTVTFRIGVADPTGQEPPGVVLAETTLALFLTAADAFKARYGDPRR